MTELETIERAKMYLDKMANGIDPLTDKPIPDDDTLNNVRISRCLFFVSDVLRRVLENGGVGPRIPKPLKTPFELTAEQVSRFEYSAQPLRITEFVKRINSLIDSNGMQTLNTTVVTNWLTEIGLLERTVGPDGHEKKLPSQRGREYGIRAELRDMGSYAYEAVYYDQNAQRFIMDNLDSALSAEAARLEMQGKPWSVPEEDMLAEMIRNGASMNDIALKLKRKASAVMTHARKLGLIPDRQ